MQVSKIKTKKGVSYMHKLENGEEPVKIGKKFSIEGEEYTIGRVQYSSNGERVQWLNKPFELVEAIEL